MNRTLTHHQMKQLIIRILLKLKMMTYRNQNRHRTLNKIKIHRREQVVKMYRIPDKSVIT